MRPDSAEQSAGVSGSWRDAVLATLISVIVGGAAIGGFLIGRNVTRDAFIEKVGAFGADKRSTLLTAGTTPMSLLDALGQVDDGTAEVFSRLYGVPHGDRQALVQRLRDVAWQPPYRPAPFVGHIAGPVFGDDLRINVLGFRDERQSYLTKPEQTVRVFITGGSTAWGSGATSQKNTISYLLEQDLNQRVGRVTGYRYEVINTALPAWATTQERLLIEQRLVDMHPDLIIMFSGNNDVHWALEGRDIRWFYSYTDQNYITLLNEIYKSAGHPEWTSEFPFSSRPVECSDVARLSARNVEDAAFALRRVKARLVFALQPNLVSTAKGLTERELAIRNRQNKSYWDSCYQALRTELGQLAAPNYRLLDLSKSFGTLDESTELFIDQYHFVDEGNRMIAQALADQIDWNAIVPSAAIPAKGEALTIVKFELTGPSKSFTVWGGGTSAIHIVPSRLNKNLLVVFDQSILPTTVSDDALTASIPTALSPKKGKHAVFIVDGVTGESSPSVAFESQ
jgi:lysophospholipase L1-like esterase